MHDSVRLPGIIVLSLKRHVGAGKMADYHVHLCEVAGEHPEHGENYTWVIYRFGQFTGTANADEYDWHQLAMRNFAALGKRMVNGSVWATGSVFAPVDSVTGADSGTQCMQMCMQYTVSICMFLLMHLEVLCLKYEILSIAACCSKF